MLNAAGAFLLQMFLGASKLSLMGRQYCFLAAFSSALHRLLFAYSSAPAEENATKSRLKGDLYSNQEQIKQQARIGLMLLQFFQVWIV